MFNFISIVLLFGVIIGSSPDKTINYSDQPNREIDIVIHGKFKLFENYNLILTVKNKDTTFQKHLLIRGQGKYAYYQFGSKWINFHNNDSLSSKFEFRAFKRNIYGILEHIIELPKYNDTNCTILYIEKVRSPKTTSAFHTRWITRVELDSLIGIEYKYAIHYYNHKKIKLRFPTID